MSKEKIFCIGMFKTGTSSLGVALEMLGYKTHHSPFWPNDVMIKDAWYESPKKWEKYYPVIMDFTLKYDAFADYPWMYCYPQVKEWYPNAKFILTVRDPREVALSDFNWWKKHNVPEDKIPALEVFEDRYTKNTNRILNFFKDSPQLLQLNISKGEGWEKLCNFLNKPCPTSSFPHKKKGNYK